MSAAPTYFESLEELPEPRPFPQVAQQIMSVCDSPDVNAQQLEKIIQCDAAITVRMLRAANSSLYGFSGEIRTIEHAIVALGLRTVRDLSVSFAAAELFNAAGSHLLERQRLWRHSLACGAVAAQLAPHFDVARSEAFLAGVVHDVGKLLMIDALHDTYIQKLGDDSIENLIEVETSLFGLDHQQVGAWCAEEWGLPLEINSAVEFHHLPEKADVSPKLAQVVCLANELTKHWGLDGRQTVASDTEAVLRRCQVDLSDEQLELIRQGATEQVESMQNSCQSVN